MDNKKKTIALYAVFAVFFVLQFAPYMAIPGLVGSIAAVVFAYILRGKVRGDIYESHTTWLIRTFWIGTGVIVPIGLIAFTIGFYAIVDLRPAMGIVESGTDITPEIINDTIMEPNAAALMRLASVVFTLISAWWLWRCGAGLRQLLAGKPVDFVNRFWY